MRWDRIGALGGAIFVPLIILSFVIAGEPPDVEDSVPEIVEYYVDSDSEIFIGAGLAGLAITFFLLFANHLRRLFAAAGDAPLGALTLVGASIMAVGATIDATISVALTESVEDIDPASVQALQALWDNDWIPLAFGAALFLGTTGVSIIQTEVLPRWLGWVGVILFVLTFTPIGFVSFLGGGIWVIVASVMLALRGRSEPPAPAPVAPTA